MTSTGTYAFAPSAADLVLSAYGMIQIRRTELTSHHLQDAAMANDDGTSLSNITVHILQLFSSLGYKDCDV